LKALDPALPTKLTYNFFAVDRSARRVAEYRIESL
jgi:hypothetical protein